MTQNIKEEVTEAPQDVQEEQKPQVVSEIHIKIMDNGGLELYVPPESKELQPIEIENIVQLVYNQMRDGRVAQMALEMFKQRLG